VSLPRARGLPALVLPVQVLPLLAFPALALLAGCADTTGGARVSFAATIENDALVDGEAAVWTDADSGWTLRLDRATLAVGPVYLWSDEPQLDVNGVGMRLPARGTGLLDLLVPVARAAGSDQFRAGFLRAEVTDQVELDLLADLDLPLGEGRGLAGPVRSGEVWLEPLAGGETLSMAGQAERAGEVVPFSVELTFDDRWVDVDEGDSPVILRRLRGLELQGTLAEGGALRVHVDHRAALRGVDWASLPLERPDAPAPIPLDAETTAGRVLAQRLRQVGSSGPWALAWEAP
jgi:hypothetical protein